MRISWFLQVHRHALTKRYDLPYLELPWIRTSAANCEIWMQLARDSDSIRALTLMVSPNRENRGDTLPTTPAVQLPVCTPARISTVPRSGFKGTALTVCDTCTASMHQVATFSTYMYNAVHEARPGMHWKGGPSPLSGRPAYAQPLSPWPQVPASIASATDSNRPNHLGNPLQPPI